MSKKEKGKKKKSNVNLYISAKALKKITEEADEFDLSVSKFVAIILSHRAGIVEKIRNGEIVIVE